ncbi:MAG TPA: hypothetical protein PK684_09425 [Bacillota bacterium]|nr:hypothetical protein [Bacillota bacterium]
MATATIVHELPKLPIRAGGRQPYEKPVLKKEKEMKFPFQIFKEAYPAVACRQCSSCHGCR